MTERPKTVQRPIDLYDYYHDDATLWQVVAVDLEASTAECESAWTSPETGVAMLYRLFTFEEMEKELTFVKHGSGPPVSG